MRRITVTAIVLAAIVAPAVGVDGASASYWRHCRPPAVVRGDMRTHRVGCDRARRVVNKVLARSQDPGWDHQAGGFHCVLKPNSERPIQCRRDGRRIQSPLAG
jgi:hypothetical protein